MNGVSPIVTSRMLSRISAVSGQGGAPSGDAPVLSILTFDNSTDGGELHTDQPDVGDLLIATTMQTETLTYTFGSGWSGGTVLEAFSEAMTTNIDVPTTALTGTGPRRMHIAQAAGGLVSNILTIDYDADNTGPVLIAPTSSAATDVSANWGVESDEANGTIFAAARLATDLQLGYDDIENGTGNAVSIASDASPTADASNGGLIGGLTSGNSYVIDIFQRDDHGNLSNIVSTPAVAVVAYHYFEDFTSDVSADWTATGSGVVTYDGTNDELIFDPTDAWEGVSSPAITVVDGADYQIDIDLRNDDPDGGSGAQVDVRVGNSLGGNQLGESAARIYDGGTVGTITMTVTASGTSMFITPRGRGTWPENSTFSVLELRVTEL